MIVSSGLRHNARAGVDKICGQGSIACLHTFTAMLRVLARQSHLRGATDLTQYGKGRASSKAFLTHHVANISTAIQAADANAVLNAASVRSLRQSLGLD